MDDRQRSLFVEAVELGSFSKVAERHYVSPQAVSQQVRRLEDELGFSLLVRTSRGVVPTEAGRAFYDGCRQVDRDLAELALRCGQLAGASSSVLRLGSSRSYSLGMFSQFVPSFLRENPAVSVEYVDVGDDPIDELRAGRFDAVEGVRPSGHDTGDLAFLPLLESRRCCLVAPHSPLSHVERLSLEDLRGVRVYVFSLEWASNLCALLSERCPEVEVIAAPAADYQSILHILRSGDSVFLTPEHLVGRFETLIPVPLDVDMTTEYGLVFLEGSRSRLALLLKAARSAYSPGLQ